MAEEATDIDLLLQEEGYDQTGEEQYFEEEYEEAIAANGDENGDEPLEENGDVEDQGDEEQEEEEPSDEGENGDGGESNEEVGQDADGEEGASNDVPAKARKRKRGNPRTRSKRPKKKKNAADGNNVENGNGVETSSSGSSDEQDETETPGTVPAAGVKGKAKGKKRGKKKATHMRRNIRGLITDDKLTETTKEARAEEAERLRRLMGHQTVDTFGDQPQPVLLQQRKVAEDLNGHESGIIHLSSSDEGNSGIILQPSLQPTSPIAADESDSDVKILSDDQMYQQEDEVEEDPERLGLHVDDKLNVPEPDGRILVNKGHPMVDEDIFLAPQFQGIIKPHQVGGLRFLYDNLIESTSRFEHSNGFGCILAHSMGLGKTIQLVAFSDIFLRHTPGRRVLCIVPINTIQNWMSEFNHWIPCAEDLQDCTEEYSHYRPRNFQLHLLNDSLKNLEQRAAVFLNWKKTGGVLLMGYELYRLLATKTQRKKRKPKKVTGPVCIDIEEEDKEKSLLDEIHKLLVTPGPDLVICDEGHRIKNSHASISQALKSIRTKRRVVLTGYPLQNNLMEYWCMVDFVRPNYLGTKTEFSNMFERPIQNGQCIDSTPRDARLMMHRVHVLQQQLQGFVQRRGHQVLRQSLPPKREYVLLLRMTAYQRKLYRLFMEELINHRSISNPLRAFAICCKIWNHPDILFNFVRAKEEAEDLDIEWDEVAGTMKQITPANSAQGRGKFSPKKRAKPHPISAALQADDDNNPSSLVNFGPGFTPFSTKKDEVSYDWASSCFDEYVDGLEENSHKLIILLDILEDTIRVGDRLLLFSQSLFTLTLIEEFLRRRTVPETEDYWCPNVNYFRLDGSTPAMERERLINGFNADDSVKLFLVSTRAGSLGINLVGANRVVVFDASWNPCHDSQAVCRVYRYGQTKVSHIYRFVTDNSLEKKIYDRQVNKQGMADRVVDESNPEARLSSKDIQCLICDDERDPPPNNWDVDEAVRQIEPYDEVLAAIVQRRSECFSRSPFTHESLLVDRKEKKLSRAEKRMALENFEMERNSKISYTGPSYAAFYPKPGPPTVIGAKDLGPHHTYPQDQYYGSPPTQHHPSTSNAWSSNIYTGPPAGPSTSSALRRALEARAFHPQNQNPSYNYPPQYFSQPATEHPNYPPPSGRIPPPIQQPLSPYVQTKVETDPMTSASRFPFEALMKQKDVIIQELTLDTDMSIPTNNGDPSMILLKKGQQVMFIRTPKGMYLRMGEKIIKIKLSASMMSNFKSVSGPNMADAGPPQVVTIESSSSESEDPPTYSEGQSFNPEENFYSTSMENLTNEETNQLLGGNEPQPEEGDL